MVTLETVFSNAVDDHRIKTEFTELFSSTEWLSCSRPSEYKFINV